MPLWQIYHPGGTFEDAASKQALSQDITKMYTGIGLPAIYVVAQFIQQSESDVWVGGKQKTDKPFIRVVITQIAVRLPNDDAAYQRNTTKIDQLLKPHVADRGYDWEYHVVETERRLWKINGMIPPPRNSEAEHKWFTENWPVSYEGAYV
ncbi:hypothetical protein N7509_013976 [Penicillium cosmopolitanum]|uniref:Tautomerase cis-CaaD-like domain-containing protein n=1 Tax=Penicillium cosmopolitanum TaxID=1131564 RepID=A0A9W9SET7_9EURO|nr:uncharacterized protein N7509_013976 [Penicillium cosmopolitanum]KAJ5377090.1 hypothetical protein N7509_013976 [Penicillium cosmopolitanum]